MPSRGGLGRPPGSTEFCKDERSRDRRSREDRDEIERTDELRAIRVLSKKEDEQLQLKQELEQKQQQQQHQQQDLQIKYNQIQSELAEQQRSQLQHKQLIHNEKETMHIHHQQQQLKLQQDKEAIQSQLDEQKSHQHLELEMKKAELQKQMGKQQQQQESDVVAKLQLQQDELSSIQLKKDQLAQQHQQQLDEINRKQQEVSLQQQSQLQELESKKAAYQQQLNFQQQQQNKELDELRSKYQQQLSEQQHQQQKEILQQQDSQKQEMIKEQRQLDLQRQQQQEESLKQQQMQYNIQLQQNKLTQQRDQQTYVHQPYATSNNNSNNAYHQAPVDPRFEELQKELRQERESKGELMELLRSLKLQLEEMRQELELQRTESKKESVKMQALYLEELEAERAQVKMVNRLRESEVVEEDAMEVDNQEEVTDQRHVVVGGSTDGLHQSKVRDIESERKKGSKEIDVRQLAERELIRARMAKEVYKLEFVQAKWDDDARKEANTIQRFELAPEYWPANMVLTEEMYAADGRGVYLTTTTEVRKRMAGDKPGAWQTLTLATLSPMNEAKEVQVVLKEKVDDGVKRTLRRLWLSALGREVLPIGTDTDATVKTKELVVRIEKKWTDNKRWSEVKRSPMKATQELRKMPGYVDTYNARVGDQNVTVMLRVKATEVRSFLKVSGNGGTFTKEKDHTCEQAVKASVLWLPKDDTLSIAQDKAEEIEGGLGLVLNEHGLGIRASCWHEKAAREKLHLPAKLPETRISGIPIGTTSDDAIKYLISREGWEVRKMKDGVRNGMRWMVVRGPERDGETVTIDGVLCLIEPMKKVVVAPTRSVKVTPKAREQKPEKRRDLSESSGKWYTRAEFIAFHGKKKGIRLWGEASQNAQDALVKPVSSPISDQQKQSKKEKNIPPKDGERKKCSVEDRLERLERLLMSLVGSK